MSRSVEISKSIDRSRLREHDESTFIDQKHLSRFETLETATCNSTEPTQPSRLSFFLSFLHAPPLSNQSCLGKFCRWCYCSFCFFLPNTHSMKVTTDGWMGTHACKEQCCIIRFHYGAQIDRLNGKKRDNPYNHVLGSETLI